jgi:hypothetical protein
MAVDRSNRGPSWTVERPSPLQNRVTPSGEILAHPSRGLLMGNRGCIHRPDRQLGAARWRSQMWICCVLRWRDVRRDVMPPGRWTALFFLDEATALSAGHRPCGYCRREDHLSFAEAWRVSHELTVRPRAREIDTQLHRERVDPKTRAKLTWQATVGSLPDGAMALHAGGPALLISGALLAWSFEGYGPAEKIDPRTTLDVLTPPGIVAAIEAGYRPLLHPSAGLTTLRSVSPS